MTGRARIAAEKIVALPVLLLAAGVMLGWIVRAPSIVQPMAGQVVVFNAALCFALSALAVVLNDPSSRRRILAQQFLGAALILIAGLVASQYWFGYSLGIDWPALHDWVRDGNPFPGRMSKAGPIAFMLAGAVLVLMHRVRTVRAGLLVQALTIAVAAIGVAGLVGHFLDLRFVYQDYPLGPTSVQASIGRIAIGLALWLCWRDAKWYRSRTLITNEAQRISLIGTTILGGAVAIAVVGGFSVAQREVESAVSEGLLGTLKGRVNLYADHVQLRLVRAQFVTNRPGALAHLEALNKRPDDRAALGRLREVAESLLPLGFSAVAFYSPSGGEWLRVGRFVEQSALSVVLNRPHQVRLLWSDGLVLSTRMPMSGGSDIVGTVFVEQPLPVLTTIYGDFVEFGETGEIGVCTLRDRATHCFPQRLMPRVFSVPYSDTFPMARALAGQTGIMRTRDYRGRNVLAAHAPVGDLGLGMVAKVDTAELYAPLRRRFHAALVLLGALVAGGAALFYLRLEPLVGELERSRQALQVSERDVRMLHAATLLISGAPDTHQGLVALLKQVCEHTGWAYGQAWMPNAEGTRLELTAWYSADARYAAFYEASRKFSFSRGEGSVGQIWASGEPLWLWDIAPDPTRVRRQLTIDAGFKSLIGFPVLGESGVIAVVEFYESERRERDERVLQLIATLAAQLGPVIERKQATEHIDALNTELLEHSSRLEAVNKELEGFSYSVSHDLRAPLRALVGFSRLMVEDHAGQLDAEARRKLSVIQDEAQRMGLLVDDLLTFSRIGRRAMQVAELDMTALARATLDRLNGHDARSKARVHLETLPRAKGDRALMEEVWTNLLGNALKFTSKREHPLIEVSAMSSDAEHVYLVRDNGTGFDPRHSSKLFGVFQRLHSSSEFPGTGVGLALVERIVTRHGGRVWAEGRLNEGATFYFSLPKEPVNVQ